MKRNDPRHGTPNGYSNLGCRCRRCKDAHALAWRVGRYNYTHATITGLRKKRYRQARDAGYSATEARKRSFWSNPLA